MKDKIQIDIGIGDVVEPIPFEIPLVCYRDKPIFENSISLMVYPIETIFAEKLETALSRGASNSRMKDYHDLLLFIRKKEPLDLSKLKKAVENTFSHRGTNLKKLEFKEKDLQLLNILWLAHFRGLGDIANTFHFPQDISEVIEEINKSIVIMQNHPIEMISLVKPVFS